MATNIAALVKYPGFYHLQSIVIRGELATRGNRLVLLPPGGDQGVEMVFREHQPSDGQVEVRGTFWDVGRMTAEDPRFAGYDIQAFLETRTAGRWPAQGELLVVSSSDAARAEPPPAPSVRAVVLDPERYEGQKVTVTGTFRGNNLYGDLPRAPRAGKWDFVVRSASAALWVTGIRPKGKGFDLDPRAKVDTGRLLEVSGVVKSGDGLVWLEATTVAAPAITAVQPGDEPAEAEAVPALPPLPAPEVIFSLPSEGETDVSPAILVQIQISRNLDPESLKDRVRIVYVGGTPPGTPPPAAMGFALSYKPADRVVQIRFAKPLEPFRTVKVELLDGIKGHDGQPLKPFALTFTTGSQ
ncbi:MAG: Ig-like domain-containing protein [Planctomycetes bacterium]|nr:Ig-like domain-containing protein [Planctomycetota bacterium]